MPTTSTSFDNCKEYRLSQAGHSFRIFQSLRDVGDDWEKAQPPQNIYLQRPYLMALENAPPRDIRFAYLIFYHDVKPIGIAYCQLSTFRTDKNVQDMDGKSALPRAIQSVTRSIKTFVASRFEFNLLVCGNLLLTGEHGFHFLPGKADRHGSVTLLYEALELTQQYFKDHNVPTDGIFLKDLEEDNSISASIMEKHKFSEFTFHPNMVLYIRPEWDSLEDYLGDISSKYRVRAKKAFSRGAPFEKIDYTEDQIINNVQRLYELYKNVMDNAGFNMVVLNENYIVELKRQLGDDFRVTGYYLDGELVGYRTNIINYEEMEAHFLGYDQAYNRGYQLYLNMLYDSLRQGIEQKVKRIVYARTAMEIKSSIGAEPHDLLCYIRANNRLTNRLLPTLLEYFRPPDDWVPRSPFKDR